MTDNTPVLIAGGGPAGLTAAYELARRGALPIVFEKDGLVGGHARTETFEGYRFDIGGHRFFTKIPEAEAIWHDVMGDDLLLVSRRSRIYYNRKFFFYPLKPFNVLASLGPITSVAMMLSFVRSALFPLRPEDNFERWVINRFGRRLYEAFFKSYRGRHVTRSARSGPPNVSRVSRSARSSRKPSWAIRERSSRV